MSALLEWYAAHKRNLPWRMPEPDPYRVWLSEIMLQQTRVGTVIPYYERFLARFPDVGSLAAAPEQEVLALWSGLGYYSRARNLHRAARAVAAAGGFPRDYEGIRKLPGVGPYTAAAIASIAFGLPHAVVDGNVLRVLSRLENDPPDIGAVALRMLDRNNPGDHNQALMELGATVCLPRAPLCGACPLRANCLACAAGTAAQLPLRRPRPSPERIEATLALARRNGRVLLWQRPPEAGRMAGFWDLPSSEQLPDARTEAVLGTFRHTITHHHYQFTLVSVAVGRAPAGMRWFAEADLAAIPLCTTARKALAL